ncbi:hypothetical protein VTN02DRAFT_648 [Thermoascus thermophilus]
MLQLGYQVYCHHLQTRLRNPYAIGLERCHTPPTNQWLMFASGFLGWTWDVFDLFAVSLTVTLIPRSVGALVFLRLPVRSLREEVPHDHLSTSFSSSSSSAARGDPSRSTCSSPRVNVPTGQPGFVPSAPETRRHEAVRLRQGHRHLHGRRVGGGRRCPRRNARRRRPRYTGRDYALR